MTAQVPAMEKLHVRRVVQVGGDASTSVALARAVHSTTHGRGGLVVSIDSNRFRLERIRAELEKAGVAHYAYLCEGDARQALRALDGPFDLVWLECTPELATGVLDVLTPRLRAGAWVLGPSASTSVAQSVSV